MILAPAHFEFLVFALVIAWLTPACGDDGDGDTGAATGSIGSTSAATTSSSDSSSTSTSALDEGTSTTAADSSDEATTGPAADPTYPAPDAGVCPDGTVPVLLPGAQLCAPFCGGETDQCPGAATGDSAARCTPFAGEGGSGDACDEITPCPEGEACRSDGSCGEVAFWACQLFCDMGEACPDGMACSGIGTCGYP